MELSDDIDSETISEVAANTTHVEELWGRSLQEVEKGWSQGPYSEDQLPQGCIVSKRFAVEHGLKVRPIDDLKQSMVNSAYGCNGKIQIQDAEVIAATLVLMRRTFAQPIRGKTIDLKSAYRQLPLSEGALNKAFIAVKEAATNEVNFFRLLCLPRW